MTNNEILTLSENLKALKLPGAKFGYAVARNVSLLKPIVESLLATQTPTSEFNVYENERLELCKKLAEKDLTGRPKLINNIYVFGANQEEFDKGFTELKEKFKTELDAREKQVEDFNELLKQPAEEVALYKIKLEEVPNEIRSDEMVNIFPIIENDEKKK